MATLRCDHCGATFECPMTTRFDPMVGRCLRCGRLLADFEPRGPYALARVGVYAIERLRDEHRKGNG